MLKILIVCESSGTVRNAFRSLGYNAYSCDLLPSEDNSPYHLQGDMFEYLSDEWDLIGMHPECTYLCRSGIHWNNRGRGWEKTELALETVRKLMSYSVPWYLENPIGVISTRVRKPDQIIQPYMFGEDASKATCLWLNKLPKLQLEPSLRVDGRMVEHPEGSGVFVERWSNQTDSGQNRLTPNQDRWRSRSRTYPGIAKAMATQWGSYLTQLKNTSILVG